MEEKSKWTFVSNDIHVYLAITLLVGGEMMAETLPNAFTFTFIFD